MIICFQHTLKNRKIYMKRLHHECDAAFSVSCQMHPDAWQLHYVIFPDA